MKVFVACDEHGAITSVTVPNPAFADSLGMEPPPGGRVHVLDVAMSEAELLDPPTREARQKTREKLRALIEGRGGKGRKARAR